MYIHPLETMLRNINAITCAAQTSVAKTEKSCAVLLRVEDTTAHLD